MTDILSVISHRAEISFDELYSIMDILDQTEALSERNRYETFQVIRQLESLGYCEIDNDGRKVYCHPPYFALLPKVGTYQAMLCGARSQSLLKKLNAAVKLNYRREADLIVRASNRHYLPDTVILESYSLDLIRMISNELKISFSGSCPWAFQLESKIGSINEYLENVEEISRLNWIKRVFSVKRLHFVKKELSSEVSLGLEEYTAPYNQKKIYRFFSDDIGYKVAVDWGRYLLLRELKHQVLLYDQKNQLLAVPKYVPLPRLMAKTANLCSGASTVEFTIAQETGNIPAGSPMEQYQEVPYNIAEKIAQKLGQTLQLVKLSDQ